MIGQTISHYKILEKLGEGGMGVVYKAQDLTLDRTVALKFLTSHASTSDPERQRFLQEAKAAAALNNPNICTIHGVEEVEGRIFIVLEFVDGQTLQEKRASLSMKQALDIGIQIAEGLAAAHDEGVIHRDLKPENIMIRKDGIAQIMDFGLAKLRGASRLTKEGSTTGTAGYMSPEQVQGQDTDHRSDIFSFGILLYELLTGQRPFKGVHETAIAYEIVNVDSPPMSSIKPEIPPQLDAIVLECLEKDPNERTQSARQVAVDLKRYRRESSRQKASRIVTGLPNRISEFVPGDDRDRFPALQAGGMPKLIWLTIAVVLSAAVTVAIVFFLSSNRQGPLMAGMIHSSIILPPTSPLSIYGEAPLNVPRPALALSRDGSKLVYVGRSDNGFRLYLRELKATEIVPLEGTEGAYQPFFSPDGEWIGFFAQGELRKVSLRGGKPTTLCSVGPQVWGACWSSAGQIFYGGNEGRDLTTISADGGAIEKIGQAGAWPHLLPDETGILASRNGMVVVDIVRKETKSLNLAGHNAHYVTSGHLVYAFRGKLYSVAFDATKRLITGKPQQVTSSLRDHVDPTGHFSVADNGTIAYLPSSSGPPKTTVQWIDRHGKATDLGFPPEECSFLSLAPDGLRLALSVTRDARELWVYDLTRKSRFLVQSAGNPYYGTWGPGTNTLTYQETLGDKAAVVSRSLDASAYKSDILLRRTNQMAWSPDGKVLATAWGDSTHFLVFKNNRDQREEFAIPRARGFLAFSPDGRYLAFIQERGGLWEVYVEPFPPTGEQWQISTTGGEEPLWTNGGKKIVYRFGKRIFEVDVSFKPRFKASVPRVILEGDFVNIPGMSIAVSPDGKRFLVLKELDNKADYTEICLVSNYFAPSEGQMVKEK